MKRFFLGFLALILLTTSCDSDSSEVQQVTTYNAAAYLQDVLDNQIIPDYTAYITLTEGLVTAKDNFISDASEANLTALRTAYKDAYLGFQTVMFYGIGTADTSNFYLFMNSYPTSTEANPSSAVGISTVDTNIENEITASGLTGTNSQPVQGYPAVDYLLYGLGDTSAAILDALSEKHLAYLSVLIDKIDSEADTLLTDWQTTYGVQFTSNTSSSSTGSPNLFFNAFTYAFENYLRRQKIDIPSAPLSGDIDPLKIESVYQDDFSKELFVAAFEKFETLYLGTGVEDEVSFSDLIISLDRADLDTKIKNQIAAVYTQLDTIDASFKNEIDNNRLNILTLRDRVHDIVKSLKVDVKSTFNFTINWADSDGD